MYLETEIAKITKLSKEHILGLKKLKIETVEDLLNYLPTRYADERESRNIQNLKAGEKLTLFGELYNLQTKRSFKGHIPMSEAKLRDSTGSLKLVWFHQAYLAKIYQEGDFVKVTGLVSEKQGNFSMLNPSLERVSREHIFEEESLFQGLENSKKSFQELIPIYKETKGVSSQYLTFLIKRVLGAKDFLKEISQRDPLPAEVLTKLHLPTLEQAYLYLHLPKAKKLEKVREQVLIARKRFAFQEIFYLQVLKQTERAKAKESLAYPLKTSFGKNFIQELEQNFKFRLTKDQLGAIANLSRDLEKKEPMGRLLEGDVGSGKTLVAGVITYLATHYENRDTVTGKRLQVAIMAPTEILATQHFQSFLKFFKNTKVEIGLLTSKISKKYPSKTDPLKSTKISKPQLKKWVLEGQVSIVIGTHALIQKTLNFQNLALVIIDEQHRFGVKQRAKLANKQSMEVKTLAANDLANLTQQKQKIILEKNKLPHLLSMTATPIPRTLALTIFGDLDLTLITELPKNRKPILTKLARESERESIYQEILAELKQGYQAYIVVPRIQELDEEAKQGSKKLDLRSVSSEVENLTKFLIKNNSPQIKVVGMHSKIKKEEKESLMQEFLENKIQILVSTSVIEVGVDVPNVTRMIIEGAERFGLAQLHQLRGRIGRGERESVCYLFSSATSEITQERLQSLLKAKNGFELAEYDLNQRGIGALMSGKQWGVSDLAMEAIKNLKLVEVAKEEAKILVKKDATLKNHSLLFSKIQKREKAHLE